MMKGGNISSFTVEKENGDVAVKAFRRMVSSSGSIIGNIEYVVDSQESGTDTLLAEASFLDGATFEVPGLVFFRDSKHGCSEDQRVESV